ncbi:hypothetical protein ACTL6U_19555 [Rhodovibrionaceae bacterium A322]
MAWLLFGLLLLLAACSPLRLVEPYNPAIEQGLLDYYQQSELQFGRLSAAVAGVPAPVVQNAPASARYAASQDGYLAQSARLQALLLQSRIADPDGACKGTQLAGLLSKVESLEALAAKIPGVSAAMAQARKIVKEGGNCTVQILTVLSVNQTLMQGLHQKNDVLVPAVLEILQPTISQGVEMALRNEQTKRALSDSTS